MEWKEMWIDVECELAVLEIAHMMDFGESCEDFEGWLEF